MRNRNLERTNTAKFISAPRNYFPDYLPVLRECLAFLLSRRGSNSFRAPKLTFPLRLSACILGTIKIMPQINLSSHAIGAASKYSEKDSKDIIENVRSASLSRKRNPHVTKAFMLLHSWNARFDWREGEIKSFINGLPAVTGS